MLRAINHLDVTPTHLLIDAMTLDIDIPQTSILKVMLKVYLSQQQVSWLKNIVINI